LSRNPMGYVDEDEDFEKKRKLWGDAIGSQDGKNLLDMHRSSKMGLIFQHMDIKMMIK
jgi:hypothetical protein